MKKRLLIVVLAGMMIFLLSACGESNGPAKESSAKETKKEYIDEAQIGDVFSSPDKFKGKYVKMSGKIFVEPEVDGSSVALQVYHNPENSSNNFIVYYDNTDGMELTSDSYIMVDGKINGTFEGENAFGGSISAPLIEADSIEVLSYIDAIAPTVKEATIENGAVEQNGVSFKLEKVEYAEKETRMYVTATNASPDKFSFFTYDIKLIQNGNQIAQDSSSMSSYEGDYPQLSSDILPSASSSGVLVFPAMDSSASFQIYAEGMSDNYDLQFSPFIIDVVMQ